MQRTLYLRSRHRSYLVENDPDFDSNKDISKKPRTKRTLLVDCNPIDEKLPADLNSTSEDELKSILAGHEALQKAYAGFGLD